MPEYEVLPNKGKGWGPGEAPPVVDVANTAAGNVQQSTGRYEVKINALPVRHYLPWSKTDHWPSHGATISIKNVGAVPLMISW